jgi:selenoprotein W-related protein
LVGELLTKFEEELESLLVIPSKGGCFEVTFNGTLIYSKLATHRHAEPGEIAGLVAKKLKETG